MAEWECISCGGVYRDVDSLKAPYFHTCAPVTNPDYQPDPAKPKHDNRDVLPHPHKRDENVDDSKGPKHGKPKKEGKGRKKKPPKEEEG